MLIRNKSQVNKDLLDSLGKEEFCDVKIEAQDGEIAASKLILSIRSEYFSRMFSPKSNFVENSTGRVKFPYPLVVVERVITYLYCGEMDRFEQMEGMKDKPSPPSPTTPGTWHQTTPCSLLLVKSWGFEMDLQESKRGPGAKEMVLTSWSPAEWDSNLDYII